MHKHLKHKLLEQRQQTSSAPTPSTSLGVPAQGQRDLVVDVPRMEVAVATGLTSFEEDELDLDMDVDSQDASTVSHPVSRLRSEFILKYGEVWVRMRSDLLSKYESSTQILHPTPANGVLSPVPMGDHVYRDANAEDLIPIDSSPSPSPSSVHVKLEEEEDVEVGGDQIDVVSKLDENEEEAEEDEGKLDVLG